MDVEVTGSRRFVDYIGRLFSANYGKIYYVCHFHISYWLQCCYTACTFHSLTHFNGQLNELINRPEDGGSTFLRNVGINTA